MSVTFLLNKINTLLNKIIESDHNTNYNTKEKENTEYIAATIGNAHILFVAKLEGLLIKYFL